MVADGVPLTSSSTEDKKARHAFGSFSHDQSKQLMTDVCVMSFAYDTHSKWIADKRMARPLGLECRRTDEGVCKHTKQ